MAGGGLELILLCKIHVGLLCGMPKAFHGLDTVINYCSYGFAGKGGELLSRGRPLLKERRIACYICLYECLGAWD